MSDGYVFLFSLCVSWLWVFVAQNPRYNKSITQGDTRHEHRSEVTNAGRQGRH
jgi:hypothetical protein